MESVLIVLMPVRMSSAKKTDLAKHSAVPAPQHHASKHGEFRKGARCSVDTSQP